MRGRRQPRTATSGACCAAALLLLWLGVASAAPIDLEAWLREPWLALPADVVAGGRTTQELPEVFRAKSELTVVSLGAGATKVGTVWLDGTRVLTFLASGPSAWLVSPARARVGDVSQPPDWPALVRRLPSREETEALVVRAAVRTWPDLAGRLSVVRFREGARDTESLTAELRAPFHEHIVVRATVGLNPFTQRVVSMGRSRTVLPAWTEPPVTRAQAIEKAKAELARLGKTAPIEKVEAELDGPGPVCWAVSIFVGRPVRPGAPGRKLHEIAVDATTGAVWRVMPDLDVGDWLDIARGLSIRHEPALPTVTLETAARRSRDGMVAVSRRRGAGRPWWREEPTGLLVQRPSGWEWYASSFDGGGSVYHDGALCGGRLLAMRGDVLEIVDLADGKLTCVDNVVTMEPLATREHVCVVRNEDPDRRDRHRLELVTLGADPPVVRPLAANRQGFGSIAASPDGATMAYLSHGGMLATIRALEPKAAPRVVRRASLGGMWWSADGAALWALTGDGAKLVRIPLGDGPDTVLPLPDEVRALTPFNWQEAHAGEFCFRGHVPPTKDRSGWERVYQWRPASGEIRPLLPDDLVPPPLRFGDGSTSLDLACRRLEQAWRATPR